MDGRCFIADNVKVEVNDVSGKSWTRDDLTMMQSPSTSPSASMLRSTLRDCRSHRPVVTPPAAPAVDVALHPVINARILREPPPSSANCTACIAYRQAGSCEHDKVDASCCLTAWRCKPCVCVSWAVRPRLRRSPRCPLVQVGVRVEKRERVGAGDGLGGRDILVPVLCGRRICGQLWCLKRTEIAKEEYRSLLSG